MKSRHASSNVPSLALSAGHVDAGIKKGRYARAVLGLHVPTDDPQNRPVLERFFVQETLPALRIAVMCEG